MGSDGEKDIVVDTVRDTPRPAARHVLRSRHGGYLVSTESPILDEQRTGPKV
jgi:hypothetical protein